MNTYIKTTNETFYQFFECGLAVVDYLQENLFV